MASRGPSLLSSLPNLQNLIKRDPQSYTDEFLIQLGHYNALRTIVEQGISTSASGVSNGNNNITSGGSNARAGADEERFRDLAGFVAQVRNCLCSFNQSSSYTHALNGSSAYNYLLLLCQYLDRSMLSQAHHRSSTPFLESFTSKSCQSQL